MHARRTITVAAATAALSLVGAPAFAHFCVNASKPAHAGAQIVFGPDDEITMTNGLANRIDRGLVDLETGEGYHGIVGFAEYERDLETDEILHLHEGHTYLVTPTGEIPSVAQWNGPACRGITNFARLTECGEQDQPGAKGRDRR
jgi:hypothetical protein